MNITEAFSPLEFPIWPNFLHSHVLRVNLGNVSEKCVPSCSFCLQRWWTWSILRIEKQDFMGAIWMPSSWKLWGQRCVFLKIIIIVQNIVRKFTHRGKCVLKPEPNMLQYMIWWFWTLPFAANMMRNVKRNQTNPVESSDQMRGGEWSNRRRIVNWRLWQKLWTKNFFRRHFLKIHVLTVPIRGCS